MFTASLDTNPSYHALSYVWGEPEFSKTIEISGVEFHVTPNLFEALTSLRSSGQDMVLWADAVCIDQSNVQERNQQVFMMADIYKSATDVLVWLGGNNNQLDQGMDLIGTLGDLRQRYQDEYNKGIVLRLEDEAPESLLQPPVWAAAEELLALPYWSRCWVFQEFVLARRALLVWGHKQLDKERFMRGVRMMAFFKHLEGIPVALDEYVYRINLNHVLPFLEHLGADAEPKSLHSLVSVTRQLKSTDPRDKIYGMLGLADVDSSMIEVDYNKPVATVYTEFTRKTIISKQSLDLVALSGINVPTESPSLALPSWVPDFRSTTERSDFFAFMSRPKVRPKLFAGGTLDASFQFPDNHTLRTDGVLAAEVKVVSASDEFSDWIRMALDHQGINGHPTCTPLLQAFFRTMIADASEVDQASAEYGDEDEAKIFYELATGFILRLWAETLEDEPDTTDSRSPEEAQHCQNSSPFRVWAEGMFGKPFRFRTALEHFNGAADSTYALQRPDLSSEASNDRFLLKYYGYEFRVCSGKVFFLTADGYMGFGPRGMAPGDQACVLGGCQTPLVVRPMGTHFVIVGPCYVYGMMKGEICDEFGDRYHLEPLEFR